MEMKEEIKSSGNATSIKYRLFQGKLLRIKIGKSFIYIKMWNEHNTFMLVTVNIVMMNVFYK